MHRVFSPFVALFFLVCCLGADPIPAAADPEARKVTLYGMFQQSPQGGIEFSSQTEPDVVYLPFAPGAILGDSLGIKVQVQGEIRDSFTRQGRSYRILAVADIRPMTAEYGATTIETGRRFGLPGSDAAQVHAYHNKTCYLYDRYAVLETLASYSDGHTLRVLARTAADAPDAVCENLQGRPLFEIPNGGDFAFAGLSGDTLLVRNGQPEALHGLMAVNLAARKQTLDATVAPGASLDKGRLLYREKLPEAGRKPACPAGGTAVRGMALELTTGKSSVVGKDTCWP